ncbi:hypothetical protein [Salidesulfovibrio brasiliensis]|uniref:hypothetical protein n=1 Tax=Salidesulfovibrio brasiliensis TaxID=221711 RepID=UPI0006D0CC27|nr:hypothetical protein [Salidesulfovibrio brasiliensis]
MADESNRNFIEWIDVLAKGILAGCALGAIAGWFDILPITKAVALGGLAGCLAAINFKQRRDDRRKKDGTDQ